MITRVGEIAAELKANPPPLPKEEIDETVAFLEWLVGNNFTFLGARDYVFTAKEDALEPKHETGLGLLRSPDRRVLRTGSQLVVVTPELRAFLKEPKLLIVTKSAVRSKVHRRTHMDYIGIKRFDAKGKLTGEFRIVGLFTSTVYTRSTRTIPHLRRKVDAVIKRAGFDPDSHSGKALANVLDTYSARRAVPDRRGHARPVRDADPPARRASARARAHAPGPFRPFRLGARVRAARPLQQLGAGRDRRVSRRGLSGPHERLLSVLPGRAAGARPLHHRPRCRRDAAAGPCRA